MRHGDELKAAMDRVTSGPPTPRDMTAAIGVCDNCLESLRDMMLTTWKRIALDFDMGQRMVGVIDHEFSDAEIADHLLGAALASAFDMGLAIGVELERGGS